MYVNLYQHNLCIITYCSKDVFYVLYMELFCNICISMFALYMNYDLYILIYCIYIIWLCIIIYCIHIIIYMLLYLLLHMYIYHNVLCIFCNIASEFILFVMYFFINVCVCVMYLV